MVKVTLEFASADEAIVALGKLVGAQPSKAVDSGALTLNAGAPATRQRKGRADKGQPRGPYKEPINAGASQSMATASTTPAVGAAVPDLGKTAEQAVNPASTPAVTVPAAPAPQTTAPAAVVPKQEDAQAAIARLFNAKGMQTALEVLSRYGAKAVRELQADQYAAFIADVERVLTGGTI